MKYERALNLFWAIVWALVLIGTVAGIFWKPALYIVAGIAAVMVGMFLREYILIVRMK